MRAGTRGRMHSSGFGVQIFINTREVFPYITKANGENTGEVGIVDGDMVQLRVFRDSSMSLITFKAELNGYPFMVSENGATWRLLKQMGPEALFAGVAHADLWQIKVPAGSPLGIVLVCKVQVSTAIIQVLGNDTTFVPGNTIGNIEVVFKIEPITAKGPITIFPRIIR